jgi:uncharacterized protein YjdB
VIVAGTVLGYADVYMAENGKEARNTTTGDVIGLVDGRTLPVTFRIEVGADDQGTSFAVGPEGGTFATSDGKVILEVPYGAVDREIEITITAVNDNLNDPDVILDLVFEFLPSPHTFIVPVTVTFTFDPDNLPAGVAKEELRMLGVVDGEWVQLRGSSVDLASPTVSGPLDGFSRKAVGRGKVHAIAVTPEDPSIGVDDTQQFEATVTNVDGEEMDRSVLWSSSDDAVATIDNNGLATGVALGEATIEARIGSVRGSAALTVAPPGPVADRITVQPATANIEEGATQQFTATVYDQYDAVMDGQTVGWSSSDGTVATIDAEGVATAVSIGKTSITATIGEVSGDAELTVRTLGTDPSVVDRIVVSPASATIETGETQQFTATVYDQYDAVMDGETVTWSSGDVTVATIDAGGLATALADGQAAIIAAIGDVSGQAALTVGGPALDPSEVDRIVVSPASATIGIGETQQFTATVYDQYGATMDDPQVAWSSSSETVASVDPLGLTTGVGIGEATITASVGETSGNGILTVEAADPDSQGVVGDWKLDIYVGDTLYERFLIINLQDADGNIFGFFGIGYDPEGDPTGEITGQVDGTSIYMHYDRTGYSTDGYTADFFGTISSDGSSMTGTWSDYQRTDEYWEAVRL